MAQFQEHTSTVTNAQGQYKSAMLPHAREHQHHFRKEDVTILSSKHNWVKRGTKEALFINALKPSINIDPSRPALSSHFDTIIGATISTPPAPVPHNSETESLINTALHRQGRPRKQPPSETIRTPSKLSSSSSSNRHRCRRNSSNHCTNPKGFATANSDFVSFIGPRGHPE